MRTFVTSDLHLGHSNILKYNPATRQYTDVAHMNSELLRVWNETVQPNDTVYILGDVAFMKPNDAANLIQQLNGNKILIKGNHDGRIVSDKNCRQCFAEIHSYYEVTVLGTKVCMFHYPIAEWNQCHRGSVQLHGHLHGKPSGLEQYRVRDVGVDATGNIVSDLEEIVRSALNGELKTHGDGY